MPKPWMLAKTFATRAMDTGYAKLSFSQFGEDMVLSFFLQDHPNRFYVDVGCNDPHRFSNTYVLHHALGWRGMNVDLDARCIERMRVDRPEDVCVVAAVSDQDAEVDVVLFEDDAVNSIAPAFIENQKKIRQVDHVERTQTQRLDDLIDEHYPHPAIGLLSVDAEGHDLQVLRSIDLGRHEPAFILVETGQPRKGDTSIHDHLTDAGYELISHMVITSLYKRKE